MNSLDFIFNPKKSIGEPQYYSCTAPKKLLKKIIEIYSRTQSTAHKKACEKKRATFSAHKNRT